MKTQGRIPRTVGEFNSYLNTTTDYLLAGSGGVTNWERLTISGAEINAWIAARAAWNDLYAKYGNLDLRTRAVKDSMLLVRDNFITFAQPVLTMVSGRNTATIYDYEALHIKAGPLRDTTRTKHLKPDTHPIVESIECREPMIHVIRYKDELAGGRGKPTGVIACEFVYIVRDADNPPDSIDDCDRSAMISKSPATISFSAADSGKRAFYFLRWENTTGLFGPFSGMYHALIE